MTIILGSNLKLGEICTRTLSNNNECLPKQELNMIAGWYQHTYKRAHKKTVELTCKTTICGASRCWPKNEAKPDDSTTFCRSCWAAPYECTKYYEWNIPKLYEDDNSQKLLGYICSTWQIYDQCGGHSDSRNLVCTANVCGASRCWPENEPRPDETSAFCVRCWGHEITCPWYYDNYDKIDTGK